MESWVGFRFVLVQNGAHRLIRSMTSVITVRGWMGVAPARTTPWWVGVASSRARGVEGFARVIRAPVNGRLSEAWLAAAGCSSDARYGDYYAYTSLWVTTHRAQSSYRGGVRVGVLVAIDVTIFEPVLESVTRLSVKRPTS